MSKYLNNDAAVQIAEEAFRAGFEAGVFFEGGGDRDAWSPETFREEQNAWDNFEPSEVCKDLTAACQCSTCGGNVDAD